MKRAPALRRPRREAPTRTALSEGKLEVRTFTYIPGKVLEVITFEVKPSNAISVQAVFEALAHRRSATHAYVLLHVPLEQADALSVVVEEICNVARSHGIGVITAGDPGDFATWEEIVDARRVDPDPERLDNFISTQLSRTVRDHISRRLH